MLYCAVGGSNYLVSEESASRLQQGRNSPGRPGLTVTPVLVITANKQRSEQSSHQTTIQYRPGTSAILGLSKGQLLCVGWHRDGPPASFVSSLQPETFKEISRLSLISLNPSLVVTSPRIVSRHITNQKSHHWLTGNAVIEFCCNVTVAAWDCHVW